MRTNKYKDRIVDILKNGHLMAIEDIRSQISEADFSTIYRNIELLLKEQKIKKVVVDNKHTLFELRADHEHDHFICDDCGSIESIELPRLAKSLKGKKVNEITVHGSCNACIQVEC